MPDRKPKPVRAWKAWAIVDKLGRLMPMGDDLLFVYGARHFALTDCERDAGERVIRVLITPETSDG